MTYCFFPVAIQDQWKRNGKAQIEVMAFWEREHSDPSSPIMSFGKKKKNCCRHLNIEPFNLIILACQ